MALSLGFSSCPNDTFMFHALVAGEVPNLRVQPWLADIEALNLRAIGADPLPVTKLSVHALAHVRERYTVLAAGARLVIEQMRSPLFEMSDEPYQVRMRLEEGQMRVFTESGESRPLQADIVTPHGDIELETGSYQVAVTPEQTDITVSAGAARPVSYTHLTLPTSDLV